MPEICYKGVRARSFSSDVTSTADSFKSWDTCMDNKTCKIIAIVGIVLAAIVGIWIVGSLLRCFKEGATGITEFFCWCCGGNRNKAMRDQSMLTPQMAMNNPPMVVYQPIQPPQNAYYRDESYYDERNNSKVHEIEQDLDLEALRKKSMMNGNERAPLVYDEDEEEEHELNTYHPTVSTYQPQQVSQSTSYIPGSYNPTRERYSPTRAYQNSQAPYPREDSNNNGTYQYHHGNY